MHSFLRGVRERRRRIRMPRRLLALAVFLVALPVIDAFLVSRRLGFSLAQWRFLFLALNPAGLALMFLPALVGLLLLLAKKWTYYLFLFCATLLVIYDIITLWARPSPDNWLALIALVLGLSALLLMIQRDISAPYFKAYPRGWRGQRRKRIAVGVFVQGQKRKTIDVSPAGVYVNWKACPMKTGEAVELRFPGTQKQWNGGIVRIDDDGVGIAFRSLSREDRKHLRGFLEG